MLSYFNRDISIKQLLHLLSHVVTITHSTIQNGWTALQQASREGHQKVVELLLGAGANPDLQDKVKVEHVNAKKWYVIHSVKP